MIKLRDEFKIRHMMKREQLLFHVMLKQGITWFTLASQHSRNCIRQYRYFSRMDFNFKAYCNFNFHCAIPEDRVDMEMTIQMVDGIHTYRRDETTQMTFYSSWGRQVKSFSSLRKKITNYKEEMKESHERETLIPSPQ